MLSTIFPQVPGVRMNGIISTRWCQCCQSRTKFPLGPSPACLRMAATYHSRKTRFPIVETQMRSQLLNGLIRMFSAFGRMDASTRRIAAGEALVGHGTRRNLRFGFSRLANLVWNRTTRSKRGFTSQTHSWLLRLEFPPVFHPWFDLSVE